MSTPTHDNDTQTPATLSATSAPSQDNATKSMDKIMALCKRRGFIYPASEIYGGINGFWDYGPLGSQLKKNLRDAWWQDIVMDPCNGKPGPDGKRVSIVPVDTCIIQNPKVWEASGHIGGFNDPMVTCKQCKKLVRADHVPGMRMESDWQRSLFNEFPPNSNGARVASIRTIVQWHVRKGSKFWPNYINTKVNIEELDSSPDAGWIAGPDDYAQDLLDIFHIYRKYDANEDGEPSEVCPNCGGDLTVPRAFNLMFPTIVGATGDWEENKAYLRPETAQGIFINFPNVVDTTRVKLPFGIAQTGKAFRNEVTPRNFTFRSREFEQMEIEFFCHESEAVGWYEFWRDWRMEWWQSIGLAGDNLILREHDRDELAHYAKEGAGTSDIEYRFPFTAPGYGELEGIAHRGTFDLAQHKEHSGAKMEYFDTTRGELAKNGQPKGERYIPHCIEPSAGLDRGVLAILCEAYTVDESRPSPEFMRFHPRVAPIKAAVFPLVKKNGMPELAEKLHAELRATFGRLGFIEYDEKQSIGKRYARMDEAGCPFCFTIDGDTLEDNTVTVRDRDTGAQERMAMDDVAGFLAKKLGA